MKTYSYIFRNLDDLREYIEEKKINKVENLLVQIFTTSVKQEEVHGVCFAISEMLPNARIAGTTSTGAITESATSSRITLILFSVFESTEINIYHFENTDGKTIGRKLVEAIDKLNTKVIILYSNNISKNQTGVLKSIKAVNSNIIITGMIASSNGHERFVFTKDCIIKNGIIVICLAGEKLEAWVEYNSGWQPIGNIMTVTEANDSELISVNNVKIKDLYAKNFGKRILDDLLWYASVYPFKAMKGSVKYVIAPLKENEESFDLVSELEVGENIRFSMPNKVTIYRIIKVIIEKYINRNIETCFLYYSNVRKRAVESVMEKELRGYNLISQCFGTFSDGEYYHSKSEEQSYLYSNTCTLLFLSENSVQETKINVDKFVESFYSELVPDDFDYFLHFIENYTDKAEIVEDEFARNKEVLMHRERLATIGQMMGGVAHNLNTPICGMSGQISLLKKKITKLLMENGIKVSEDCNNEVNDFFRYVNNIDEYIKYMSNVMDTIRKQIKSYESIDIESFTIDELFKRTLSLISFEIKRNKIEMSTKIQEDICNYKITGELTTLIQILINLINNSVDAYDGIPGPIEIGAHIDYRYPGIEPYIKLYVKDSGCGIDENIKTKLFHKMVTTKGNKGTGIGIYLSNMMIKAKFNGHLDYKTEIGKGTTMNIYIPYIKQ